MSAALVPAAELAFWRLLLGGLAARYGLRRPVLGAVLLAATPVVDLAVLGLAATDRAGARRPRAP